MKRALRAFGVAVALAAPVALQAQATSSSDKPVSFGISGGASLPMGDLSDAAETGFVVAGHVYLKPSSFKSLRFRGDVSYDKWGVKGADELGVDADARSLGFMANALFDFPTSSTSTVKPYVLGGLGLYNSKVSVSGFGESASESSNDIGIQVGGGLTFQLSGFSTFVEAKYVNVFTEGSSTNWIPVSFGIRF